MSSPGPAPTHALEGRTILLLEDESLIVLDVTLALEAGGARVLATGDVAAALGVLRRERVDVGVLDVTLADGRSCEPVAERLAELGLPYVLHTGDAHRHAETLARLDAPVLPKPFPSHQLAARVAALLAAAPER